MNEYREPNKSKGKVTISIERFKELEYCESLRECSEQYIRDRAKDAIDQYISVKDEYYKKQDELIEDVMNKDKYILITEKIERRETQYGHNFEEKTTTIKAEGYEEVKKMIYEKDKLLEEIEYLKKNWWKKLKDRIRGKKNGK